MHSCVFSSSCSICSSDRMYDVSCGCGGGVKEGERERGKDGGKKEWKEGGREGERERRKEGGREEQRKGGREEGGKEGGSEGPVVSLIHAENKQP